MGKFSNQIVTPRAPITTTETRTYTHEGGIGHVRDPKGELFLLAVTNMVSEDTFYETAAVRDGRFRDLVRQVADPEWLAGFVTYLRDTMQMRSAAVVLAAEYVAAGYPNGRQVVDSALKRADEPAELLAYWHLTYGRNVPKPVKRGVADAVGRLYTERAALRYDGQGQAWRMGDVIDLVHPRPKRAIGGPSWQESLFRYLLDARHGRTDPRGLDGLPMIRADRWLRGLPEDQRRAALASRTFTESGWSWERLSGWLPGGMDREAWEAVIPNMGYMALLRNLRNFDDAGVSDEVAFKVAAKLADPGEVVASRQFPIRFLSAWREAPSLRWASALERALEASLANVPSLPGKTLILIDLSGSMWAPLSGRSKRLRYEVGLIFGCALGKRAQHADVYAYGNQHAPVPLDRPLLRLVEEGRDMGGTYTFQTLRATYQGHDRVVILTDEQAHDAGTGVPSGLDRLYTFNLAGYRPAHGPSGRDGWYTFGGLTDAAFRMLALLDAGRSAQWPWDGTATRLV